LDKSLARLRQWREGRAAGGGPSIKLTRRISNTGSTRTPLRQAVIFPIHFLLLWLRVGAAISFVGGWFEQAKVDHTRVPFHGTKWGLQSGRMRCLANYNNVFDDWRQSAGRVFGDCVLFRFMHPPAEL